MKLNTIRYLCCPVCNGELRLAIDSQSEREVLQGYMDCLKCGRRYIIKDSFPDLTVIGSQEESDFKSKEWHDQCPEYSGRPWAWSLGIWEFAFAETRARRQVINKLELKKNALVLETGVGNGPNLPIIAEQIGKGGQFDGIDISLPTLKVAQKRTKIKGIQVELVQGNASFLPYKKETFDAVLHIGAFNAFTHKKRSIQEMCRVAKSGSKIVICDEGLAPGKEKTLLGKWILRRSSELFSHEPPVELLPDNIEELNVSWVWQSSYWVIAFRKI